MQPHTPQDEYEAQLVGVEIAAAIMLDKTPVFSHEWQEVETDMKDCVALLHPNWSVMQTVRQAIGPLTRDPYVCTIPGIDMGKAHRGDVVYVHKT